MSRASNVDMLRAVALAVVVGVGASGCGVEAEADYPSGYYGDYPPDAYIATTEPVYYGGFATYWYGDRWYYRDGGGRWSHYDREPPVLAQRRMQGGPPVRRTYEVARPRPAGRAPSGRSVRRR